MTSVNGEKESETKVSAEEVASLYAGSTELEQSEDAPPTAPLKLNSEVPGSDLFNGLVNAAPFSEYLHYKAKANCTHKSHQDRIRHYSREHRCLAWCCMVFDLIFRIAVVLGILAVVVAVVTGIILKTVYR